MNRRQFLACSLSAAPAIVVGAGLVELLSTRSIFLPPRGGWIRGDYAHFDRWVLEMQELGYEAIGGARPHLPNPFDGQLPDDRWTHGWTVRVPSVLHEITLNIDVTYASV